MEFRFKALHQQHDPDDLDTSVNLANPKSWIAVFVTLVLIVSAIVWATVGTLPQTATGQGVITRVDGVIRIEVNYAAVISAAPVAVGNHVAAGDPLVTVADQGGASHRLLSPSAGTVMTADYRPGVVISAGTAVITLERDAVGAPLSAMIVVPTAVSLRVQPGMAVDLNVDTVPARAFGVLHGRVSAVSQYPVTGAGLEAMVYDATTVRKLLSGGPAALVTVELITEPTTVSGYAWTSPAGPPYPLAFQSAVDADIHLGQKRPIEYVFGDS